MEYISATLKILGTIVERNRSLWFIAFLASGGMLFLPQDSLHYLAVDQFASTYRGGIGAVFIVSSAGVFVYSALWTLQKLARRWENRKEREAKENLLKNLTEKEMKILGEYLQTKSRVCQFSLNGLTIRLQNKGIISRAGYNDDWVIEDWAWEYLKRNPGLVLGDNANHSPG